MGAVGGLLGTAGGQAGTGFETPSGTNQGQLQAAYQGNQQAMGNQQNLLNALQAQNGLGNQSQVYNQLQGVVNGQGPNPAQAQLAQATGANVANQAALMAGQRGAAANPALIARQAAMQGANIQQQAAGQGATMQAQQSLGALGQAGAMAGTMANQQIGQTNQNATTQQNEQNILQGANSANNQVQGQLANTSMQGQQALVGGLMSGFGTTSSIGGAAAAAAHGGVIEKFADGGSVGPQSMFGQALMQSQEPAPMQYSSSNPGADALKKGTASSASAAKGSSSSGSPDQGEMLQGSPLNTPIAPAADQGSLAKGGKVPAMVSPGEKFLKPNEAKAVAQGKVSPSNVGKNIPGQAKVKGDSYSNDTVPAKLEEGGVVIPRSVMQSKNPEKGAADFVRAVMAKKRKKA